VLETLEPTFPQIPAPIVISEIPQTWEDLEALEPDVFEPILETRPGLPPDPYPQPVETVTTTQAEEEEPMAHDWGHLVRQGIGELTGIGQPAAFVGGPAAGAVVQNPLGIGTANGAAAGCDGMAWSGGVPPKGYKVVNHCGVGVLRKIRRRRRRRMLTASDASDLAQIIGMAGKGQMATSLINRRS